MTISTELARVEYLGNDLTTVFPYPFMVFASGELVVTTLDPDADDGVVLVEGTDYTVSGVGELGGGSVTLTAAPATDVALVIRRVPPLTQELDLRTQGTFHANVVERAFDRLVMIAQALQEQLDRALLRQPEVPVGEVGIRDAGGDRIVGVGDAVGPTDAVTQQAIAGLISALTVGSYNPVTATGTSVAASLQDRFAASYDINDFGADPAASGTTNRAAIQAALDALQAVGGGRLTRRKAGTYQVTGTTVRTVPVPISGANYTTANQGLDTHFYVLNPSKIHVDLPGVVIESTKTDGGLIFLFDGPQDCSFLVDALKSPTVAAGGVITTNGMGGLALTTTTRNGFNFVARFKADHIYTGFYVFGDPASSFRMSDYEVDLYHDTGLYAVALHDNGDYGTCRIRTENVGRDLFAFGVDSTTARMVATARLGGYQTLIKAYDRDTTNTKLYLRVTSPNFSSRLGLQSEHHPATQPVPARIRGLEAWFDDHGSVPATNSILFDYLQDGVITGACSTNLFDGIKLMGKCRGQVASTVLQGVVGALDTDELLYTNDDSQAGVPPIAIYAQGGFYRPALGTVRSVPRTDRILDLSGAAPTTGTTQYGAVTDYRGGAAATALIIGQYLRTGTVAASFTNALLQVLRLGAPTKGAGSTITKAVGLFIEAFAGVAGSNYSLEVTDPILLNGIQILAGTGSPEGAVAAPVGSIYFRTNGGAGTSLYVKESGAGNTGWVGK